MAENKANILAILEILKTYSDEDHMLTRKDFDELLLSKYGISIERRTLYNSIATLNEFGYDISNYSENGKGYYLRERQFEKSEVNLLCNSVFSSHIIPENESNQLIDKLLKTQSKYEAKKFKEKVYSKNLRKTINRQFFLNIELINEAISDNKKISFIYTKYNYKKERVSRSNHLYTVSPYAVVYMNENYYLICNYDGYEELSHYRIDKMNDIKILNQNVKPIEEDFEPYEYAKNKIYMFGGKIEEISLLCNDYILDDIIDKFGKNTIIIPQDNNQFIAKINASKQGITYWILQYMRHCSVLEPQSLKDEIKVILNEALENYK